MAQKQPKSKPKPQRKRPPTQVIDETPDEAALVAAPSGLTPEDLEARRELARYLLDPESTEANPEVVEGSVAGGADKAALAADLSSAIPFPKGLEPTPQPEKKIPDPDARLKKADVLVVTWTVAEQDALADVLTPGFARQARQSANSTKIWYPYTRHFKAKFLPQIRKGAPSRKSKRLGSWMRTRIGDQTILCFKSELHLNQDGIRNKTKPGTATLPVRDLFDQLIDEVQPEFVLTVGTSGGVFEDHDLGDVVVTRAAKFRLHDEFKNSEFNYKKYINNWKVPTKHFQTAVDLMDRFKDKFAEPALLPPTKRYPFGNHPILSKPPNVPDIKLEGKDMPEFHPILTTDYFEFGTSSNHLDHEGCAVEMDDAVLGLVCSELDDAPSWAVVRNLSDPLINGDLPVIPRQVLGRTVDMKAHWAVWYYQTYGYWTSVMSALTTWALIAGL